MLIIGLLWHSTTSDNLGVGALTESQISIIRKAALNIDVEVEFRVFGTNGGKNYLENQINLAGSNAISLKRILLGMSDFPKKIKECDVVFDIGEGDSFADIYGQQRFVIQILSKLIVLKRKIPLILSPQTIGPFAGKLNRQVANYVMERCTKVYGRDGLSYEYLEKNVKTADIDQVVDVAFRLPFERLYSDNGKLKIGLNVSGLLFNGGYTGTNQFGLTVQYPELVRALIEKFLSIDNVEVWLVPHVLSDSFPVEDDVLVSKKLQTDYPMLKLAPYFNSPSEAKSFISGMDFFVGARMHACIAAFSSGVPVVPLAYSRKFNGLFNTLGYGYVGDCKEKDNDQILSLVTDALSNLPKLSEAVRHGNAIANEKLSVYEQFIELLLRKLSHG